MFQRSGTRLMLSTWCKLAISAIATTLALCLGAVSPTSAQAPATASLAGQLLIASPSMADPRFERTVILMVRHDKNGAFGIVVNRPIGEHPLAAILEMLGEKETTVAGTARVFAGGPVQPEIGFIIHSPDYQPPGTTEINGPVAMTASRDIP